VAAQIAAGTGQVRRRPGGSGSAVTVEKGGRLVVESDADRDAYLQVKRDLARRTWRHVQHHADAKTAIVEQIIARATLHLPGPHPGLAGRALGPADDRDACLLGRGRERQRC